MNVINLIIAVYRKLHEVAPGSEAGKRFMSDIASWGLFQLVAAGLRVEKPSPQSEKRQLALAAIAGCGARSQGPDWLEDQLRRIAATLVTPSVRERGDAATIAWAAEQLPPEVLRKAEELKHRFARSNADRNAKGIDGALRNATVALNAAGVFTSGHSLEAELAPSDMESFLTKVKKHLAEASAYQLAIGEHAAAVLLDKALRARVYDELLEPYEPAFDDSWLAEHEATSPEAQAEDELERQRDELDRVYADVQSRTA